LTSAPDVAPIPVSLITGFLGAGKTTLLNRLLRDPALGDALVIVNEWGEIGLDHLLVEKFDGDTVLLASGCLCCSLRGDLLDALDDLLVRRDAGRIAPFKRILIETTGLADPGPILHAMLADPARATRLPIAGIVTLVDAVNGAASLDRRPVCARQIAVADVVAVSKSDLVDAAAGMSPPALRARIRAINPHAPIKDVAAGEMTAEDLFREGQFAPPSVGAPRGLEHEHAIRTHTLRWPTPIEPRAFAQFIDLLRAAHGPDLLRVKGLIALADDPASPLLIHGAQHVFHAPRRLPAWPDADHATRIVFITDGIERHTIDAFWAALVGEPRIDAPDQDARVENPLAPRRAGLFA
jgi:G3E family GTPase